MSTPKTLWQNRAREIGGDELVEVIDGMAMDIHNIKQNMDRFLTAFPNGDIDGHREYHRIMIERNRELRHISSVIREKTVVGLVWMIIIGIGISIWHELINLVAKGQ